MQNYRPMKKLIQLFICLLTVNLVQAQENSDTTRLKFGDTRVIIIGGKSDTTEVAKAKKKKNFNSWAGIDLGFNALMTSDGSFSLPKELSYMELDYARSLIWNLNLIDVSWDWLESDGEDAQYHRTGLGIISGIGLTYRSFSFENNTALINVNDSTFGINDTTVNYDKNKLRSSYLRVPVMLQFYTKQRKDNDIKPGFHIAAGVVGGLRLGTIYKRKYELNGKQEKHKLRDDYNLTPFTLDAEVRIGYGDLTLFANYGLTSFFEKDKGPELYAAAVGLSLTKLF